VKRLQPSGVLDRQRVFICADHGLAVFYFLQSNIVQTLLDGGVEVVVLTEDHTTEQIRTWFGRPGLTVEGMRLDKIQAYQKKTSQTTQFWVDFLRRAGAANKTNLAVVDSYIQQVKYEAHPRRRQV